MQWDPRTSTRVWQEQEWRTNDTWIVFQGRSGEAFLVRYMFVDRIGTDEWHEGDRRESFLSYNCTNLGGNHLRWDFWIILIWFWEQTRLKEKHILVYGGVSFVSFFFRIALHMTEIDCEYNVRVCIGCVEETWWRKNLRFRCHKCHALK